MARDLINRFINNMDATVFTVNPGEEKKILLKGELLPPAFSPPGQ